MTYERTPNLIVFSSGEQKELSRHIEVELSKRGYKCYTWCDIFSRKDKMANYALLPTLLKKIPTFDFAIIIGGADDIIEINRNGEKIRHLSMRDNVIFELGLSVMALGQYRTILIAENGVRLFDDLIGVHGIYETKQLSTELLGIKSISYENKPDKVSYIVNSLDQYIQQHHNLFMPIVIGASCSTAVGYYEMFIKRLVRYFLANKTTLSRLELNVLIPYQITENIYKSVQNYYRENELNLLQLQVDGERSLSFFGKITDKTLTVVDIPTTIGTSYATASKILSLEASDIENPEDKHRFLQKESDTFYFTLTKLIKEIDLETVSIIINRKKDN